MGELLLQGITEWLALQLLLCGSMISHMEELLAERNPLYGRKTLALDLAPLSFRDASQFVARRKAEDKLVTAGVFGGIPFYLQLLDQGATLQSETREVAKYASVLAAIAAGCTKHGEIIGRVRELSDSRALGPYLEKLERMRLISIVKSMDASPKERDRLYFIADPLIAFWYRFVQPNLSSVAQSFGAEVWRHQIFIEPCSLGHLHQGFGEVTGCSEWRFSCNQRFQSLQRSPIQ